VRGRWEGGGRCTDGQTTAKQARSARGVGLRTLVSVRVVAFSRCCGPPLFQSTSRLSPRGRGGRLLVGGASSRTRSRRRAERKRESGGEEEKQEGKYLRATRAGCRHQKRTSRYLGVFCEVWLQLGEAAEPHGGCESEIRPNEEGLGGRNEEITLSLFSLRAPLRAET
jgi:hypothetical protein